MTLLFATVEDDDICQMLFILVIRFMLLCGRTLFCLCSSCCQADIYKLAMKRGSSYLSSDLLKYLCCECLSICVSVNV